MRVTGLFVASAAVLLVAGERSARAAARVEANRRLRRFAGALAPAFTPDDVLASMLRDGVEAAQAKAGLIALLVDDDAALEVVASHGYDAPLLAGWMRFPLDAEVPVAYCVRTGRPLFIGSEAELFDRFPVLRRSGERRALACLPLAVDGRLIGCFAFSFDAERSFDERERRAQAALARRAEQALEQTRRYEELRAAGERVSFLAEASEILSESFDYASALQRVAELAVPRLADWCTVDVVHENGRVERLAVAHADPAKVVWPHTAPAWFPSGAGADVGVPYVLRTGRPQLVTEVPRELLTASASRTAEASETFEQLRLRSLVCVPIAGRDRLLGALTLVSADPQRLFARADLELAIAVAGRVAAAVENALCYREAERQAEAARALTWVGDAVVLLDRDGVVGYLNPAAERLAGVRRAEAIGRFAVEVIPGWRSVLERVPLVAGTANAVVAIAGGGRERWFSVAAVDFGQGRVYALHDVSAEQALKHALSHFVATASHELRTPLTAVYGAARTLARTDIPISPELREHLSEMIETSTTQLTSLIEQMLTAAQLDSEQLPLRLSRCDVPKLARGVLDAARQHAPATVEFELSHPDAFPGVGCDEDKLRHALTNLIDNAVKYSPGGGRIVVGLRVDDTRVRITVSDQGLGIPAAEQARVFDKFARLDPHLAGGVGGSGLGLYTAQKLIQRMGGNIHLASAPGNGSTFEIDLPTDPPTVLDHGQTRYRRAA